MEYLSEPEDPVDLDPAIWGSAAEGATDLRCMLVGAAADFDPELRNERIGKLLVDLRRDCDPTTAVVVVSPQHESLAYPTDFAQPDTATLLAEPNDAWRAIAGHVPDIAGQVHRLAFASPKVRRTAARRPRQVPRRGGDPKTKPGR
ncbi:MAG: hypothetical protein ACRDQZ_15325 [Mycobacteriales bacterium]